MSRYGLMRVSLISFQMMRVISSPSSSTTVPSTLIFDIGATLQGLTSPLRFAFATGGGPRRGGRPSRPPPNRGGPACCLSLPRGGVPGGGASALRACRGGFRLLAGRLPRHVLRGVGVVVTADIDRIALYLSQFGHDGVFVLGQRLGQ